MENKVSIIIPTIKNAPTIDVCLESIFEHNGECIGEVILVNNGEEEINEKESMYFGKGLRILNINSRINSISKSWNIGLLHKKFDIALISNNDVAYSPGSISNMVEELINSNQKKIISPVDFFMLFRKRDIIFENVPKEIIDNRYSCFYSFEEEMKGGHYFSNVDLRKISELREMSFEKMIGDMYGGIIGMSDFWSKIKNEIKVPPYSDECMSGFSFMLSNDIINRVGLFDENFRIGFWEDVDFEYRCKFEGFSICICENAYIHHVGSSTFRNVTCDNEIHFHRENKEFLDEKKSRFYSDIKTSVSETTPISESLFRLPESKMFSFSIIIDENVSDGNCLCFNNVFGDPLLYFGIRKKNDGLSSIVFGYHSKDIEGEWFSEEIRSSIEKEKVGIEIRNGKEIYVNGDLVTVITKDVESMFFSLGDSRGKTKDSNAEVSIVEFR